MRFNMAPPSKGAPMSSSDVLELRGRLLVELWWDWEAEFELDSEWRSFMRAAGWGW
jgi:hypothetical protein